MEIESAETHLTFGRIGKQCVVTIPIGYLNLGLDEGVAGTLVGSPLKMEALAGHFKAIAALVRKELADEEGYRDEVEQTDSA